MKWIVYFNDGSTKTFSGWWTKIIRDIAAYCDKYNLETTNAELFNE